MRLVLSSRPMRLILLAAGLALPSLAEAGVHRTAGLKADPAPRAPSTPRAASRLGERRIAVLPHGSPLEDALPRATAEKDLTHVLAQVKDLAKDGKRGVVTFDIDDTLVQSKTQTPGKAEPGALAYVKQIAASGGQVVYLTARPFFFKGRTTKELEGLGFPVGEGQTLMTNPDPKKWNAVEWKQQAKPMIEKLGTPVAFFDNDLANVRMLRHQFPKSSIFRLDTVDGHADPGGAGQILVIKDFN